MIKTKIKGLALFCLGCLTGLVIAYGLYQLNVTPFISEGDAEVSSSNYQGIDVSRHQGKINWQQVANDKKIQFVYLKATEGASYTDPTGYILIST